MPMFWDLECSARSRLIVSNLSVLKWPSGFKYSLISLAICLVFDLQATPFGAHCLPSLLGSVIVGYETKVKPDGEQDL
jgi:hypothetical protein